MLRLILMAGATLQWAKKSHQHQEILVLMGHQQAHKLTHKWNSLLYLGLWPAQFTNLHQDERLPCQSGLPQRRRSPQAFGNGFCRLIQAVGQLDGNPQRFPGRMQVRRRWHGRAHTRPDRGGPALPLFGLTQARGVDTSCNNEKGGQHKPDNNDGKDDPGGHTILLCDNTVFR